MKTVWSSGGGRQSNAIAVLIINGEIPKPDIAVIVDTEREMSSTWDYYDTYTKPALEAVGVDLVRLRKSEYATVDLWSKNGETFLMPVFTDFTGVPSKLPTNCSNEWKSRVVQRYCSALYPDEKEFQIWLGMTIDEPERIKQPTGKWQNEYPLVKKFMNARACIDLVKKHGWPEPPKSTCQMCPNKRHVDWLAQQRDFPQDFEFACQFDEWLRTDVDDTFYLHKSCKPLRMITQEDAQPDLFTSRCDSGYCFV